MQDISFSSFIWTMLIVCCGCTLYTDEKKANKTKSKAWNGFTFNGERLTKSSKRANTNWYPQIEWRYKFRSGTTAAAVINILLILHMVKNRRHMFIVHKHVTMVDICCQTHSHSTVYWDVKCRHVCATKPKVGTRRTWVAGSIQSCGLLDCLWLAAVHAATDASRRRHADCLWRQK